MYSKVQIDNVQEFAKIIGDSVFWELLIDKKVTRLDKKTEYIIKSTKGQEHKGIAYFKSGRVSSIDPQQGSDLIIKVNYGNGFYSRYSEEMFINQFNDISPSILFQEILDFYIIWSLTIVARNETYHINMTMPQGFRSF